MIVLNIDVTKIPKTRLYKGKKGTYLGLALMENRDGRDQYGNDGFVKIELSRDAREAGEKGEIIGNWKDTQRGKEGNSPRPQARQNRPAADPDLDTNEEDDIPL